MTLYQPGMTLKALLGSQNLIHAPKFKDEPRKKEDLVYHNGFSGQAAYMGPVLWDKSLRFEEEDLRLEYMLLDEFLRENIPDPGSVNPAPSNNLHPVVPQQDLISSGHGLQKAIQSEPPSLTLLESPARIMPGEHPAQMQNKDTCQRSNSPDKNLLKPPMGYKASHEELMMATVPGQADFDPRHISFTDEDLRPQPMVKKSKKVFVPGSMKDARYWTKREKNNIAAKRSRDARRIKENQISMRAAFLEKENKSLKEELKKFIEENAELKKQLAQMSK